MCIKPDCHTINRTGALTCEACNDPKPNLLGWGCVECGTRNHKGIKSCKSCGGPSSQADGFWCCASCNKNNKIDLVDDNSRCGYCGYDMAPMSRSEAEVLQKAQERSEMLQMQQEYYDDIGKEKRDALLKEDDGAMLARRPANDRIWKTTEADAALAAKAFDFGDEDLSAIPAAPKVAAAPSYSEELDMPDYKKMTYDDDGGADEAGASGAEGGGAKGAPGGGGAIKSNTKPIAKPKLTSQLPSGNTSKLPSRKPRLGTDAPMGPPGFEWMCRECGQRNPGETEGCVRCETLINPSEWTCGVCGGKNHRSRGKCFDCQEKIQVAWTCQACRNETSIYDGHCRTCRAPRPEVTPIPREEMPMFGIGPRAPKTAAARGGGLGLGGRRAQVDWYCLSCKTKNFGFRDRCYGCDAPRPGSNIGGSASDSTSLGGWGSDASLDATGAPIERAVGDNNWMCRFCRATNFRTRTECWQCKKPAMHAGMQASSSGGAVRTGSEPTFQKEGFQPGHENAPAPGLTNVWGKRGGANDSEWTCTKCFSKNFKGKKECFKCGAAKTSTLMPKVQAKKPVKI